MPNILIIHHSFRQISGAERMIFCAIEHLSHAFNFSIATLEDEPIPNDIAHLVKGYTSITATHFELFDLIWVHKILSPKILSNLYSLSIPIISYVHDHEYYCLRKSKYFPLSRNICDKKAGLYCLFPCLSPIQRSQNSISGITLKNLPLQFEIRNAHLKLPYFTVGSTFMKKELITQGYNQNTIDILPPLIKPRKKTINPDPNGRNIFYIGQVTRGKGIDILIQALVSTPKSLTCHIIGEGNYLDYCKQLAFDLNINDRIEFHGLLPWNKIEVILEKGGIGVFPSLWPEPFGMSGPEMMQHSIPIVASNVGGISDWCIHRKNGLLFKPKNHAQCASHINYIFNNPSIRKQLSQEAKKIFESDFSLSNLIPRYSKQLHSIMNLKNSK